MFKKNNLLFLWLEWYLWDVPKEIFRGWKNFLRFNLNYFSIPLLLRTFFTPWRRYAFSYGRGFDIGRYLWVFFSNLIFRILGAIVRSFLVIVGTLTEILILFAGFILLLGWFVLPLFLLLGLFFSFRLLKI